MTIIEIFVLNLYKDEKFRNMHLAIFNYCSAIFINIRINFSQNVCSVMDILKS